MKDSTICFSGHRVIPKGQQEEIWERLRKTIISWIGNGYSVFQSGGARGFDMMAAQAVLKIKDLYPHIRLVLVLPCSSKAVGWKLQEQTEYEWIKTQADEVIYISKEYTRGCIHQRNRYLVDTSSVCICYLTTGSGGTAYTTGYAQQKGLEVINIASPLRHATSAPLPFPPKPAIISPSPKPAKSEIKRSELPCTVKMPGNP